MRTHTVTEPAKRIVRVLVLSAVAFAGVSPASAIDALTNLKIANIQQATPSCADNPGPVVGRVSGEVGVSEGPRLAAFIGCFASLAECNAWRARASAAVDGRIVYNRCEPR